MITKEQADAIEEVTSCLFNRTIIEIYIKDKFRDEETHALNSITLEKLVKALYIGYEVEPEYSVGDWIYVEDRIFPPQFYQIKEVEEDRLGLGNATFINLASENFRHATESEIAAEKERRWWSKHGRGVWELRKGDVLYDDSEMYPVVVDEIGEQDGVSAVFYAEDDFIYLCDVKQYFKVVCFAENRLDSDTHD